MCVPRTYESAGNALYCVHPAALVRLRSGAILLEQPVSELQGRVCGDEESTAFVADLSANEAESESRWHAAI